MVINCTLSVIGLDRVNAVLKREAMIKANHPKDPIAYLWFIGVNPQLQGKGVGNGANCGRPFSSLKVTRDMGISSQ